MKTLKFSFQRGTKFRLRALSCALAAAFATCGESAMAALAIPDLPLVLGGGAAANLLYIHDDSGSMYWSFMPNSASSGLYSMYASSDHNFVYYNPDTTYVVPPNLPANSVPNFADAWYDGYDFTGRNGAGNYCGNIPRRVNLSNNFKPTWEYECYALPGNPSYASYSPWHPYAPANQSAYYYKSFTKYFIPLGPTPSEAAERQNFANWYSYYRNRNMAAKAGIARAFDLLDTNIRVGWGRINKSTYFNADGKNLTAIERGVRPFVGTHRQDFFTWLYGLKANGGTPLKRGLDAAGQYYDRSSGSLGPWADNPAAPGSYSAKTATFPGSELGSACRKSFTILMTDGEWNQDNSAGTGTGAAATSAARLNVDGAGAFGGGATWTSPPRPDSSTITLNTAPFKDNEAKTLADIAMYYWYRDLLPSAPNKVGTPAGGRDPGFWQHMTTYTIAFGNNADVVSKNAAFAALAAGAAPVPGWPVIDINGNGTTEEPAAPYDHSTDDMLHAAVNGHGDFFSAGNPQEFVDAMAEIINSISSASGGSGNLGSNGVLPGASGSSPARNFNSTFNTEKWSGDLSAVEIVTTSAANSNAQGVTVWNAAEQLPAPAARHIFTRNLPVDTIAGAGVPFTWANLNSPQQDNLSEGGTLNGPDVLAYLRGDGSKEGNAATQFRARHRASGSASPLGDSPHNKPLFHNLTTTVYLGANDGMLHAFDADTGVERFAYVPSALFPKLSQLTHQDYGHKYYVDGMAAIADNVASKHYLVGALGRGGKGLYGLDITNVASFSASDVKWELNGSVTCGVGANAATLDDLGLILGEPVIAKLSTGDTVAIVGNGYNSCYGKAALYIVDVSNGNVLHKVDVSGGADNGLSTPFALLDDTGVTKVIYAGDLNGNFWRFVDDGSGWKATFGGVDGSPMFVAKNASGQIQPITAQPVAAYDGNTLFVFFGTGQFLQAVDKANEKEQSWYGLIDDDASPAPIARGDLKQRHLLTVTPASAVTFGSGEAMTLREVDPASAGPLLATDRGWVIDFDLSGDKGERIVSPVVAYKVGSGMVLSSSSIIPSNDPCDAGGRGYINYVSAFTGDNLAFPLFDTNGDGVVDANDAITSSSGIGGESGMPGNPPTDLCTPPSTFGTTGGKIITFLGGTDGGVPSFCNTPSGIKGRISWRELIKE